MISIGILSYNSPLTLKNTLMSYSHYGIFNYSDDIFCVIQPSDKSNEEIKICNDFNIKYYLEEKNNMMLGGMKRVFTESKYDCVLWTENDFRIHKNKNEVKKIIDFSEKLILNGIVDLVRVRNLKLPGHPINTKTKYYNNLSDTTKIDYSCYFTEDPHIKFPNYIEKYNENPDMYIMSSKNCGYTNNCFITSKKFFNDIILKNSKGNLHIEPDIDEVWGNLNLVIGISDGFLTHVRMDGHNGCWCCHEEYGGINNSAKCECCVSDYINDVGFVVNDGNDVSKFSSGNEWLKYV